MGGPSWLQVSLENPEVKFAVLKRMMQLTGIRIPDAHLNSTKTASALLKLLVIPPKPRKVVDALSQKEDLITQRQGAGVVYLNVFHPDIISFLSTKKENADEKVRVKTLS